MSLQARRLLGDYVLTFYAKYLLEELERVLSEKFKLPRDLIEEYIWLLHQDTIMAGEADPPPIELKDKSDVPIIGAAMQANADVLITGDSELQKLSRVEQLVVLSPRGFWNKLKAHDSAADADKPSC